jgi:hypothetical protein
LKDNPKVINIIVENKKIVGPSIILEIKGDNLKERDFDSSLVNDFS